MEYSTEIMELAARASAAKSELNDKNSNDTERNTERSMAVYDLVTALREAGHPGPQARAAELLGVSREIPSRHMRKARRHLERVAGAPE